MKRNDFIKVIKLRSCWKIDRRIGDYKLPNNERISIYVEKLVREQIKLDKLAISHDGDLKYCGERNGTIYEISAPFEEIEQCGFAEQESRIEKLVREIVG